MPPESLRRGPFRAGFFRAGIRDERLAAVLGRALGIAFSICLVTGLISHYSQQPPAWLNWPSRPFWGYRVTQGLHVATGIASIPLLLAKLWAVYPRLFGWPSFRTLRDLAERLSVAVLVGSAGFELVSGVLNTVQWYPWTFFFPVAHYYVAWLLAGSVVLHLAVKWPVIRRALSGRRQARATRPRDVEVTRRGFLWGVGGAVAAVTLVTVGQTIRPLERLAVLAPRKPSFGPQGLPVNNTADEAKINDSATDPGWRLEIAGPNALSLSLADLQAMPQHSSMLPISCVEGWSANAHWRGVRMRDLLDLAGAPHDAEVRLVSLQQEGNYRTSHVRSNVARSPRTLIALELNGEPLALDHGFPARLISPNRPGVLQTKWLSRMEIV